MASLQARHSRSCPLYPWSTFEKATRTHGCTCPAASPPLYYLVQHVDGKLVRDRVGHNRKEAQRQLDARRGDLASGAYVPVKAIRFDKWADLWLAGLSGKPGTKAAYGWTLGYAKRAFGSRRVRDLDVADVQRMLDVVRDEHRKRRGKEVTANTLAKHTRQLSACLEAAVAADYAARNPVRRLHGSQRPKVTKGDPSYLTDAELRRLWVVLADRPLMLALCQLAATTGLRAGELFALRWGDLSLTDREIRVSRTFGAFGEMTSTKGGAARTVDLVASAYDVLARWYAEGRPDGDGALVFEREEGGHLTSSYVLRWFYRGLEQAGIPRVGERGGRPRTFHSLRHTYARITLESGAELGWVQRQMGHSSVTLTSDLYGRWSRSAEKSQADRLAGAFPV